MWQYIKGLHEQRAELVGDMKGILKVAESEKRDLTSEESAKFDDLNRQAESKLAEIERHRQIESQDLRAGFGQRAVLDSLLAAMSDPVSQTRTDDAETLAYRQWICGG